MNSQPLAAYWFNRGRRGGSRISDFRVHLRRSILEETRIKKVEIFYVAKAMIQLLLPPEHDCIRRR